MNGESTEDLTRRVADDADRTVVTIWMPIHPHSHPEGAITA